MTEVLIVARTRIGGDVCVGGLRLDTNANVRLMTRAGRYQPVTAPFRVGEVYDIELGPDSGFEPPHVENARALQAKRLRMESAMPRTIRDRVEIIRGNPRRLFDAKLRLTSTGRPYIARDDLPTGSVAFWEPDRDLRLEDRRYVYPLGLAGGYSFTYAGVDDPLEVIPAGTIVRVSLARWWPDDDPAEVQRCYSQISGWYSH